MTQNLFTVAGAAAGLVLLTLAAAEAHAAEVAGATLVTGTAAVTTVQAQIPAAKLQDARSRRERLVQRLAPAFQIVP